MFGLLFLLLIIMFGIAFLALAPRGLNIPFFILTYAFLQHIPPVLFYFFDFDSGNIFFDRDNYETQNAALLLALIFTVFIASTVIGYYVFYKTKTVNFLFPDYNYPRSDFLMFFLYVGLTILGTFVALFPILQTGNIFQAIYAVRNEGIYAGYSFLIQIIRYAGLIGAGFLAALLVKKKRGDYSSNKYIAPVSTLFIFNLLTGLIMGGKSHVVIPIAFFALSYFYCVTKTPLRKMIMPVAFLSLIVILLQFGRVSLVHDSNINNPVKTAYKALNFVVLDVNIVYLETLNEKHEVNLAEDFYYGILGVVPRSIWQNKPDIVNAGGRLKQSLAPHSSGGWPVFGYNQLYSNFGWLGVFIGGMIYGLLLSTIQTIYGSKRDDPLSFVIGLSIALFVLSPNGIKNEIFADYILFVIPLFIFKIITHKSWLKNGKNISYG